MLYLALLFEEVPSCFEGSDNLTGGFTGADTGFHIVFSIFMKGKSIPGPPPPGYLYQIS